MRPWITLSVGIAALLAMSIRTTSAAEPLTWEPPGPNRADEPIAPKYSASKAVKFLDAASVDWQDKHACMTCHTNYAYLFARPMISGDSPAHRKVRQFAEQLVAKRWQQKGPRWDAEVVATAAALAFHDSKTTGKLHRLTRTALDRMWTVQREDGGWTWLKCGWPPMESDDHYGVTLAAIAVGVAADDYAKTEQAQKGLAGIRRYLRDHPPKSVHHRAMMLWASSYVDGLVTDDERNEWTKQLRSLQKKDGGWALATLGDWKRADGSPQDVETSDGYGTGFVLFVLRRIGTPIESDSIQRGVRWLKSHQRESGRWFTRSLHSDGSHFISHAGSAMAMMALAECEAL